MESSYESVAAATAQSSEFIMWKPPAANRARQQPGFLLAQRHFRNLQPQSIYLKVIEYFCRFRSWRQEYFTTANGVNGVNGVNGISGVNGINGVNDVNGIHYGTNGINGIHNGTNDVNGVHGDTGDLLNGVHHLAEDNGNPVTHLDGIEQAGYEPIAVIGFSLKFPQDATSPEAFWKMMTEKRCSMTEWPKERLNLDAFYHPDSSRPDTIPFKGGHFLEEPLGKFDAPFFSITPTEAAAIDPQHRLLLETAYRALENAGISLEKASGSKTSVHTGCFADDYRLGLVKDPDLLPTYGATGVAVTMLAARLSWFFNLRGPCVNLDSACSSSMMALDLACQGLRNKDSNMALVGGANLLISLEFSLMLSNMNFISHDSRSFSFDHRSNGYGRGEGMGVIVLKRLSDALRDGDTIRAVVRSTGSNQDGRTPGITQPSQDAQEVLINETYAKAGLDMRTTRYVEAHGTGTAIGDPIEASAIGRAFRKYRSAEEPMYIGAVKSNIGHLEGASGVAGVIKTIMVLETGIIPPNANFERLNPDIDADSLKITFPLHSTPWPCRGLRRASISSFGFGGSNSHAIIDDAYNFLCLRNLAGNHWTAHEPPSLEDLEQRLELPKLLTSPGTLSQQALNGEDGNMRPNLLVWSTADEGGLARLAQSYDAHVSQLAPSLSATEAGAYLSNLAYTLAARRSSLNWKLFAVARSIFDLHDLKRTLSKPVRSRVDTKLGYVFTGQGAQFARMSKDLFGFPAYLNSLRRSEMYLDRFGCRWSLLTAAKRRAVGSLFELLIFYIISCSLNQEIKIKNSSHQHSTEEFGRGPPLALQIASPGSLNSLQFVEDFRPAKPLASGEIEITVEASGVNFRDCLTALGQLDNKVLGGECSGVVSRVAADCDFRPGDRVAALFTDTYRTFARGPVQCVTKIPDDMTYAEASALPVVFFTAWYGLCDVARLQQGESILIHAGAGGTGQAAIQVAKHIGAEIYVTVGSDDKKKLIMETYAVPEDHILYSRNTSFAQGIMRMTGNRGVDVVLNSLSGEGLVASWECIAPFGRFVKIGKRDINSHGTLPFDKNATFSSVDILAIMTQRPSFVFGISEIESAFRHFQSGRNSGKMVIEMRKHDMVHTVIETKPDYHFDEHSSYLIAGGLGGLGRSAARWMVSRGVRNLILLSRSGARSETAVALIEELKSKGAHVEAPACDVTKLDMLRTVLESCAKTMPPVKGVIQGSMVLSDAILEKMTFEDWITSTAPKVSGT
ncbi:hypothetical protein MMC11_002163 [Xylographa trunciseda]|nr:hypothetical protein [Xylographa trunciseda]